MKKDKYGLALENALMKMDVLFDLYLQCDVIPSCLFTAESLRYLESVELDGTIRWPAAALEVRTVRPNLVWLGLTNENDAPKHIQEDLKSVGFKRSWSKPAYRLSYKQGYRVRPKPSSEASSSILNKKEKKKKKETCSNILVKKDKKKEKETGSSILDTKEMKKENATGSGILDTNEKKKDNKKGSYDILDKIQNNKETKKGYSIDLVKKEKKKIESKLRQNGNSSTKVKEAQD